jgi:hypothetical protein
MLSARRAISELNHAEVRALAEAIFRRQDVTGRPHNHLIRALYEGHGELRDLADSGLRVAATVQGGDETVKAASAIARVDKSTKPILGESALAPRSLRLEDELKLFGRGPLEIEGRVVTVADVLKRLEEIRALDMSQRVDRNLRANYEKLLETVLDLLEKDGFIKWSKVSAQNGLAGDTSKVIVLKALGNNWNKTDAQIARERRAAREAARAAPLEERIRVSVLTLNAAEISNCLAELGKLRADLRAEERGRPPLTSEEKIEKLQRILELAEGLARLYIERQNADEVKRWQTGPSTLFKRLLNETKRNDSEQDEESA